jgi:hypothetical protein
VSLLVAAFLAFRTMAITEVFDTAPLSPTLFWVVKPFHVRPLSALSVNAGSVSQSVPTAV